MLRNVTKSDRDVMLDTFENNCRQNAAHRAANSCLIDVSSRRPRRFLFFECGFMMRSAHPVLFCSFMFIPYIYIYCVPFIVNRRDTPCSFCNKHAVA